MRNKLTLLFAMLLCIASKSWAQTWTWTGEAPAAGNFYIYNTANNVFLKKTSAVDSSPSNATLFTLSAATDCTIAYEDNGTKYVYESTGGASWGTTNNNKWTIQSQTGGYYVYHRDPGYTWGNRSRYISLAADKVSYPYQSFTNANRLLCFISQAQMDAYDDFNTAKGRMGSATWDTPQDVSGLIINPKASNNLAWTLVNANYHDASDADYDNSKFFEISNWGATSFNASAKQTIKALPAGTYLLTAWVQAANDCDVQLQFGSTTTPAVKGKGTNVGLNGRGKGWFPISLYVYLPTASNVEIGALASANSEHQWSNWDNFELFYFGNTPKADLSGATYASPVEAVGWIANPSFETGNIGGWTNDGATILGPLNTSPANNPKDGDWFVEKYWGDQPFDFNQTVTGLPAGKYRIAVNARNESDKVAQVYANDATTNIEKNNTATYSVDCVLPSDGSIKLGVKTADGHVNGNWFAIDNFTLTYYGNSVEAVSDALANGGTAVADKWYAITIPADDTYKLASSATISYTLDGTKDANDDDFATIANDDELILTAGTIYVKAAAGTTITFSKSSLGVEVGTYFFRAENDKYIARGADWGTRTIVDDWGLPITITDEGQLQFYDTNLYQKAGETYANGEIGVAATFTFEKSDSKYYIKKGGDYVYVDGDNNLAYGATPYLWTIEPLNEHHAVMEALKTAQKTDAYTASGFSTAVNDLAYTEMLTPTAPTASKNWFQPKTDEWRKYATWNIGEVTLSEGLYCLRLQGFGRFADNEKTYGLHNDLADVSPFYIYFGDTKTMMHSVMDAGAPLKLADDEWVKNDSHYPNGVNSALMAFKNNKYINEVWVYLDAETTLNYGVKIDGSSVVNNWAAFTTESLSIRKYMDKSFRTYENLLGTIKKMTALNAKMQNVDLTQALIEAQQMYDGKYGTEADVTSVINKLTAYITSEGWTIENTENFENPSSWTKTTNGEWAYGNIAGYGTEYAVNGKDAPTSGMFGETTGNVLGVSSGWGAANNIKYTKNITDLEAGHYVLYYETYNANMGGNAVVENWTGLNGKYATRTDYAKGEWATDIADVDIYEDGTYEMSVGGVIGSGSSNDAAIIFVDHMVLYRLPDTPASAIADNSVGYLRSVTGEYVSRGADSGTEAALDNLGIAVKVINHPALNVSKLQFVDNDGLLFANADDDVYTNRLFADMGAERHPYWTIEPKDDGYTLFNTGKEKYLTKTTHNGELVAGLSETPYVWHFDTPATYQTHVADFINNQAASVAKELGHDDIYTVDALETMVAGWNNKVITDFSTEANAIESFEYTAGKDIYSNSINGLTNGLYKVEVEAFHRMRGIPETQTAHEGGYDGNVAYIEANGIKIPLKTLFDNNEGHATALEPGSYWPDFEYNSKWYPNGTPGAKAHFNAGHYINTIWVYVADGTLNYNIINPATAELSNGTKNSTWTCYRGVKVTRYFPNFTQGEDATFLITNPGFELDGAETRTPTGWTIDGDPTDKGAYAVTDPYKSTAGSEGKYLLNIWNFDATGTRVSQELPVLPAGTYLLSAKVATGDLGRYTELANYSEGTPRTVNLSIGSKTGTYTRANYHVFGTAAVAFTANGTSAYTIEIEGADNTWYKADNFTLTALGNSAADYATYLSTLLTKTEPWTSGGTYETNWSTYSSYSAYTSEADLLTAIEYLTSKYPEYAWDNASYEHPYDITGLIQNSSCEYNDDWAGSGRSTAHGDYPGHPDRVYFTQNHESGPARTQNITIAPYGAFVLKSFVRAKNSGSYAEISVASSKTRTTFTDGAWTDNEVYFSNDGIRQTKAISINLSNANSGREADCAGMNLYYVGSKADYIIDKIHYYIGIYNEKPAFELTEAVPVVDATNAKLNANATVTRTNPNGLVYLAAGNTADGGNNVIIDGTCANLQLTGISTFYAPYQFEATNANYNLTAVATHSSGRTYATLMVPFAVSTIPAEGKIYSLTEKVSPAAEIIATEVPAIAANSPVLVTKTGDYSASNVAVAATTEETYENGQLVGRYTPALATVGTYVLQDHAGRVAFFHVVDEIPTITPFHAYIKEQLMATADARELKLIFDDDLTGVEETTFDTKPASTKCYDLSGRQVQKPQHGIFIVNGKKVVK